MNIALIELLRFIYGLKFLPLILLMLVVSLFLNSMAGYIFHFNRAKFILYVIITTLLFLLIYIIFLGYLFVQYA